MSIAENSSIYKQIYNLSNFIHPRWTDTVIIDYGLYLSTDTKIQRWYNVSPTLAQDWLLIGKMLDGQHISNKQFTYLCWHNGGRKLDQTWLLIGKILDIMQLVSN